MSLIGQQQQQTLLRSLSAHTLLFTGPEGVGRRQVARWYAAYLNCTSTADRPCGQCPSCRQFEADHPDYREISPQTTTSTGRVSRKQDIRIGQLVPREDSDDLPLSRWLETRPTFCKRVGVIDGAERLTIGAANAFLKVLEEPPSHAVIILIASSAQAVLPTIASRSTVLRFGTTSFPDETHPLARLGRIGDHFMKQDNETDFQTLQDLVTGYLQSLNKGLEATFEAADALEKAWSAEQIFDLAELLLARLSQQAPSHYQAAHLALERFEKAVSAYSSASLAMQVLSLELRSILGYS